MFKLNKKVKYALIALKHMRGKQADQLTTAKEICDAYQISFDTTAHSLQVLAQNGIVQAAQGAHGGYLLIKDLNDVSLRELNDIIVGPVQMADCLSDDMQDCRCIKNCIVISPLLLLNEKIQKFMEGISIGSLIDSKKHPTEARIRKKVSA